MATREQHKQVMLHKKQLKRIKDYIALNPKKNMQDAMEALGLSYNTHRHLMLKDGIYRDAIHDAQDKEWRDRILKNIARRKKNKKLWKILWHYVVAVDTPKQPAEKRATNITEDQEEKTTGVEQYIAWILLGLFIIVVTSFITIWLVR